MVISAMTMKNRLSADLAQSQKSGEKIKVSAIRMAKAAIKNAEIAKGAELDDAGVVEILARQAKQHRESIAEFKKGGRGDLVDKEEAELAVVMGYLPQQMSRADIEALARKIIEQVGGRGPGDKGKVMGLLMPQVKGRADGKDVNAVVSQLLEG